MRPVLLVGTAVAATAVALLSLQSALAPSAALVPPVVGERPAIGVEHAQPLPLAILAAEANGRMRLELRNDGAETIRISLPADWRLDEVRGTRRENVIAGEAFGLQSLMMGSGVSVAFRLRTPSGLDLFNPSRVPVRIRLQRTDIAAGFTEDTALLLQETPARIW
jgi:hypothetical protein